MSKYQIVEFRALYPDAKKPEYKTEGLRDGSQHAYVPRQWARRKALRIPLTVSWSAQASRSRFRRSYEGRSAPGRASRFQMGFRCSTARHHRQRLPWRIKALLVNLRNTAIEIRTGETGSHSLPDCPWRAPFCSRSAFANTARGAAGFGGTGKN